MSPEDSLAQVVESMRQAGGQGVRLICTPENYVPGLRGVGFDVAPPDPGFLAHAEYSLEQTAIETGVAAIVGIERITPAGLLASVLVVSPVGVLGWQDKVQIDPSEDGIYVAGTGRRVFQVEGMCFGVSICHEGWRYPETVRWAARRGAKIVFHPHFIPAAEPHRAPSVWADPANSFHEKAALCRAAENGIYFASVNYAIPGSSTTSAIVGPDGSVVSWLPYGRSGLLVADVDPACADGLLARRLRAEEYI
jgi:predicted amidohydrolase